MIANEFFEESEMDAVPDNRCKNDKKSLPRV